ncbi:T-cell differentiation antigen CD6 isoform X1 [Pipistrellus kuhlii]|uniref:T-cell differentiation antigen CD6 isoform X1 n=1 Tax=Pipistrellus kuhlii TaxID=59472 RepID=UPI001E26F324|nr:T-cell differentiation antigen CD6 isoform X1 [Pipistrellus kuhlii]
MAPRWLFLAVAGLLTAGLSGHPSPAPSGPPSPSRAESQPPEPGPRLEVRLVNGSSRCSGAVQVWAGASWETPCGLHWDRSASEAACRALGCGGAGRGPAQPTPLPLDRAPGNASGTPDASGTPNATWVLAPAVQCSSSEWRLCRVEQHPCPQDGPPAQVTCAEPRDLRLADGGSPCAGRVEMLERGQWGSLCDDTWALEDAHVVCGQLSCGWAVRAVPGLHFAAGRGPIHRDQVNCSGTEAYLWDCPGRPGEGYCGHKEDAGVVCSEHQTLRLTGGVDGCEGQVEVHYQGVWSTVCDSEWYRSEAGVLCRALGCGTVAHIPRGPPHALPGRMYYSCQGNEAELSHCRWRFNNSNLCRQSKAARVVCSGSRKLLNGSASDLPTSAPPATEEPAGPVPAEDWTPRELALLVPCAVLGALLLGALVSICVLLLRVKGKYALPAAMTPPHRPAAAVAGANSYQEVPKGEAPKLPIQAPAPPPADSDSGSDSDYEHYDFSAQPPVALTTFYNSQRYRVTEEAAQQSRFRMPPVEEDPPSLGPQRHPRSSSGSSTSSGEGYCNSPSSRPPPWGPLPEQPPRLELAGSQGTFSGPSADDGSSTSSGEWYQNFQPPPLPPPPPEELCPGSASPQPVSTDNEDYDDIGAA